MRMAYYGPHTEADKDNLVADALSRSMAEPSVNEVLFVEKAELYALESLGHCTNLQRLEELRKLQW